MTRDGENATVVHLTGSDRIQLGLFIVAQAAALIGFMWYWMNRVETRLTRVETNQERMLKVYDGQVTKGILPGRPRDPGR